MKRLVSLLMGGVLAAGASGAGAYELGDWLLRAGAVTVDPDTDSDRIDASIPYEVDVDDDTQLSIIPVYMVTDKLGVELLLATPFEHDITVHKTPIDAGSTKQLPPTLSVQWYPRGGNAGWQPYIGVGVNYTIFFDEDADSELVNFLGVDDADLDLDNSLGLAAQAGVDFRFGDHWAINVGVWYIDIDTEAEVKAKVNGQTVTTVEFDVDLDPWVYNVGIAYRF